MIEEFSFKEKFPRWPVIMLAFAMMVLYGLGSYAIINFLVLHPEAVVAVSGLLGIIGEIIYRNLVTVSLLLGGVFTLTIVSIPLILKAMAKFGREVMMIMLYAFPIVMLVIGIALAIVGIYPALLLVLVGGIGLFFVHRMRERVSLGGHIFELSARSVGDELGTIVPSFLFGLFSVFTGIMGAASGFYVWDLLAPVENDLVRGAAVFLLELVYVWVVFSFMYLTEGTIIGIVDDWYRNPTQDKANLKKGFTKAWGVAGPIIQYGFVMALLATIARTVRRTKPKEEGGALQMTGWIILRIVSALAYGLAEFVTYFTLPAIVIEKTGFKNSIKRSYNLIWKHWVDVIIAYIGIGSVYAIFMILMLALYGTAGVAVGWLLVAPALATETPPIFVSILTAILFILVGFIPAYFLFRPVKAAYNTILYEFAKDMEANFELPSRLPEDIKQQFQTIIAKEQTEPRMSRWTKPTF